MREAARNKVRATLARVGQGCYVLSGTLQFKTDGSVTTVNETGEEGSYCYGFLAPLYDQRGEWTLTVTELVGFKLAQPRGPDAAGRADGRGPSRIVYEAGRWLPYYETSQPQLLRSSADCGGFSLDALPEGTLENVPTTHEIMSEHTAIHQSVSEHITFSPFGYVAIIGAMAIVGARVLIWYRRERR